MTRGEILEYIRSRLDVMNSNVLPSFEDEEIFPYLNRAQLIITKQQHAAGNFHLFNKITKEDYVDQSNITSLADGENVYNSAGGYPYAISLNGISNYFLYINSFIILTRINDPFYPSFFSPKWIMTEPIDIQYVNSIIVTPFNKPYFLNPRIVTGHNQNNFIVYPDDYTRFIALGGQDPADIFFIKYLEFPTNFENMASDTIEPDLDRSLHQDIADKAADLMRIPIDSQEAAKEVQADEMIKNSTS